MKRSNSFIALHSPVGANASFAMGMNGSGGGFMHMDPFVPFQELYIGSFCEETLTMLPYFSKATCEYRESFVKSDNSPKPIKISYYTEDQIEREYNQATDTFDAKNGVTDLKFQIFSPSKSIPDAEGVFDKNEMKFAVCPSIITQITIDNSNNTKAVKGFFGVGGLTGLCFPNEIVGVETINGYGFAAAKRSDINLRMVADFDPYGVFGREHYVQLQIAPMGMMVFDVPAGAVISVDIALAWYKEGVATHGANRCKFYYNHFFKNISEVFEYTFEKKEEMKTLAMELDQKIEKSDLNEARKFIVSHAIHSYNASTMLFDDEKASFLSSKPRWCVNEGSFMMINTLDLAIDHAFYELDKNPWVVRNVLDTFAREYSYTDTLHSVDENGEFIKDGLPGGLSFCHDHGTHNTFSPHGYSSYEVTNQDGCFSYMTQEQLCNWILISGLYYEKTKDFKWLKENAELLEKCLFSLLNRDSSDSLEWDGVMDLDSDRCGKSSEITTYDSLDHSLGQARRNTYLATKCWAAYLTLEQLYKALPSISDHTLISTCGEQAQKCASTIEASFDETLGFIPAILDGKDKSVIIPTIEALIYPYFSGCKLLLAHDSPYSSFIEKLKTHAQSILKPGICLFDDGGWKLSSNNENSWMSKIFLCQFSAKEILGVTEDTTSDFAHMNWWISGCTDCPGIDQIYNGRVSEHGFHYPRSVSSYVWLL